MGGRARLRAGPRCRRRACSTAAGSRGLLTVLPFVAAFAVSAVVYWLAADLRWATVTLFVVCAPLVILIPGATITTGVVELAAGDVVSGGGRFVSGLIMWATLAVGIAAGAAVVGSGQRRRGPRSRCVPGWAVRPAVLVSPWASGCSSMRSWSLTAVLVVVLSATYGVVALPRRSPRAPVASGIAAAVMLPGAAVARGVPAPLAGRSDVPAGVLAAGPGLAGSGRDHQAQRPGGPVRRNCWSAWWPPWSLSPSGCRSVPCWPRWSRPGGADRPLG